ncbi:unnamed protein product [Peniophora sp. CBMAI 1063]|nr:unnamed protein product [Peniophora sp. CBMAI 1063]
MASPIHTRSGTAYAAKVVAGSHHSTPARRPDESATPFATPASTPSRIPVLGTQPNTQPTASYSQNNSTNPTNSSTGGAGASPAPAHPTSGTGPEGSPEPEPTRSPAPDLSAAANAPHRKASMANRQVQRACKYLADSKLMQGDEAAMTLESLAMALLLMGKRESKNLQVNFVKKVVTTIGDMVLLHCADLKTEARETAERHEHQVMEKLAEDKRWMEGKFDEIKEIASGISPSELAQARTATAGNIPTYQRFFGINNSISNVVPPPPPPPTNPRDKKARNAEYTRARQVLFAPCISEVPEGVEVLPPTCADAAIADRFRTAIRESDLEKQAGCALLPLTVRRVNKDILVHFPTPGAANWIRSAEGSDALEHHLRYHITAVDRKYKVVAHIVPTIFTANNAEALREIEATNELPAMCIERAQYIKPEALRNEGQRHANVMLTLNNPYAANSTILDGIEICGMRVQCWRQKYEPPRCVKCQYHGHILRSCHQTEDTCGICGEEHRTRDCPREGRLWCVSCKTNSHSSRNRKCPSFLRRCVIYDTRHPENCRVFFPTEEAWTLEAMIEPGASFATYRHYQFHRRAPAPASSPKRPAATLGQASVVPGRSTGNQQTRRQSAAQTLDDDALWKQVDDIAMVNNQVAYSH